MKWGWILLALAGCAAQDPLERDLQHAIDAENWELCQRAYKQHDVIIHSRHGHRERRQHMTWEIREDLMDNGCRAVLGSTYWITQ